MKCVFFTLMKHFSLFFSEKIYRKKLIFFLKCLVTKIQTLKNFQTLTEFFFNDLRSGKYPFQ